MGSNKSFYYQEGTFLQKIFSWIFTVDHKRIGVMYLWTIGFFFLVGGIFSLILRYELMSPDKLILTPKQYNQVFTLHGIVMTFLVLVPSIPAAFGNFILPLQVGAKDLTFPKLNLLSYHLYVIGAILALYSIVSGAVDTGWTFYAPYSMKTSGSVVLMLSAAFILGFSSILTGINFISTIHKLRAKGMYWGRVNLFLWALYGTSVIQILATPVVGMTLVLLIVERVFSIGFFDPTLGGDPVLFQHFFWFYSHPVVYVMILPAMGVVSEVISTFSKKKIFGYEAVAISTIAISLLGFFVWGHHMYASGQSEVSSTIFSIITMLIGVPSAIKVFNWLSTMYKGTIEMSVPLLWVLGFIYMFTIGGLTGIAIAVLPINIALHDTYYIVAHFHFVMVGSTIMASFAALHYWWPKMFGKMYNKSLGIFSFLIVFFGFNLTFLPQFLIGSKGGPRRYYNYPEDFAFLHQLSTIGAFILALGFFMILFYLMASFFVGKKADKNPWGSLSLEWTTDSPPISHNFVETPIVEKGPYDYEVKK